MNFLRVLARFILALVGWKLLDLPQRPDKAVVVAYPHTSNWDFPLALLYLAATRLNARWVGKDTMFHGWRGPILRKLGGVPVNRRERTGFVDRVVDIFNQNEKFNLLIATEGTRRRQDGWKSGFYRIAIAAGVPVLLSTMDYKKKELGLIACIELTGDETADMARIAACYEGRQGYRPHNASPVKLL